MDICIFSANFLANQFLCMVCMEIQAVTIILFQVGFHHSLQNPRMGAFTVIVVKAVNHGIPPCV